jgi:hypothetical protein
VTLIYYIFKKCKSLGKFVHSNNLFLIIFEKTHFAGIVDILVANFGHKCSYSWHIYIFAIFQPTIFKFWILREDYLSTRSTAGLFDRKPRSSGIELRLGPSQIKVFSLHFINFWETINGFQLISQGYSKIQIFQKKFFLRSIGSSW